MTIEQERHLTDIIVDATSRISKKYRDGAAQYPGCLADMSPVGLLDNAIDEAIDQVVYLLTLRSKLSR